MRFRIEYRTHLNFDRPAFEQAVELRLVPRQESYQNLLDLRLEIDPAVEVFEYRDTRGNRVHHFNVDFPHQELKVMFRAEVENLLDNPFDFIPLEGGHERPWLEKALLEDPRLNDYLLSVSDSTPDLRSFSNVLEWPKYQPAAGILTGVQEAMVWLRRHFSYLPGTTAVHAPFREVLEKRAGVCQDFAHLLIALIRSWGFPARYVMGYQYLPPGSAGSIEAATHAWTEVLVPGRGWVGFDASQQLLANQAFIPVAVGCDSQDAAPQRGCFKGGASGGEPRVELNIHSQQ